MNGVKTALLVLSLFFMVRGAAADTIHLKNGRTIRAETVRIEDGQVVYRKFGAVVRYPLDQVAGIEKGPGPVEAAPPPASRSEKDGILGSVRSFLTPDPGAANRRERGTSGEPMTIQSLIRRLEHVDPLILIGIFAAPPVLVWLLGFAVNQYRARKNPWRYLYSVFVYLVSAPGMLSCVLLAYGLFFLRQNLLEVNVFVYFLQIGRAHV